MSKVTVDFKGNGGGEWPPTHPPVPMVVRATAAVPDTATTGRGRRRLVRALVLAAVIVVGFAGAALGYSALQPTVYGAQADIVLTPRAELSDAAADRAMTTQTMIVTSDPVLDPVAGQAGVPLRTLRREVSAEIVGRSNILRVTVGDASQPRAVSLLQLVTDQYLRVSTAAPEPPVTSAVLSTAAPLPTPLQPRPGRALAAGVLLGLLVAAAVLVVLVRPRALTRPAPYWE